MAEHLGGTLVEQPGVPEGQEAAQVWPEPRSLQVAVSPTLQQGRVPRGPVCPRL